MEILDEYQDTMAQSVTGDVNIAQMAAGIAHHRHTPDSPMSHQEEESDPDRQDEESGEELLQQPAQSTNHSLEEAPLMARPISHLSSLMSTPQSQYFAKKGLEVLQAAMSGDGFNLPFPFPPPAGFLAPGGANPQPPLGQPGSAGAAASNGTNGNALPSSASSHSSESSQGSGRNGLEPNRDLALGQSQQQQPLHNQQQQTSWSFEEQFKQVRQLYEINDDPKRKEFLDDLFTYMQKRGTPINRLPIMAKSVLDLYELYNLVIARGGLVDVINKKLWQEIIKGLHLPSSITSAAFTLRTQYMKYLYPYECEKKNLSTPAELQAAIDGNRREGRRSNYSGYGTPCGGGVDGSGVHQRSPHAGLASLAHSQISPLSLVTAVQQAAQAAQAGQHQINPQSLVNGSAAHTPLPLHPHHPQHGALGQQPNTGMAPEIEMRMAEYVKQLQREMGRRAAASPPNLLPHQPHHRPGSTSPPSRSPNRDAALLEMSRLTLWNMYNNNLHSNLVNFPPPASPPPGSPHAAPASPEPQKEALDLGLRSSPSSSDPRHSPPSSSASVSIKRENIDTSILPQTLQSKRQCFEEDSPAENNLPGLPGTHIKISNRGDGRDNSLVVSLELNGVMYQGVLFAQGEGRSSLAASTNNNETKASTRNVVS